MLNLFITELLGAQNILVTVLLTILPGAFGWYQGWIIKKNKVIVGKNKN